MSVHQHPETGMIAYFLSLRAGSVKEWGSPTQDFWCCHGSLVQAHTIYENNVYYEDDEGLVIGQRIPSALTWERGGTHCKSCQESGFIHGYCF